MRTPELKTSISENNRRNIKSDLIIKNLPSTLSSGDGLRVVIQPQHDLRTGNVLAAEALIRWQHPQIGNIPPTEFLPHLDGMGLESVLFEFVLKCVLDLLCTLRLLNIECPVAINASASLMADIKTIKTIENFLKQAELPAHLLKVEVTEDKPTTNLKALTENLSQLRADGFCVSMDDFGTGHSTLERLISLPFSELKIDKTFITQMLSCASSHAIVLTSLELGRKLGLKVVAEGVETNDQSRLLQHMGCKYGQGFGLTRPLEMKDFITKIVRTKGSVVNDANHHSKIAPNNKSILLC
ncbi:EAL domain-containing protein [Pseudomonas sp. TH49]|uniref:EAL domain-containing protein n=1 Tax=Pseudomonas sp. TH49 TaxID=2796413 RepID=UPI0019126447|nr:EAL domain-containing protein [Pseudomonas sp. TH49]MBK5344663.1 EAL domain-containing protein [Pseudomonas sp. TH49]